MIKPLLLLFLPVSAGVAIHRLGTLTRGQFPAVNHPQGGFHGRKPSDALLE